MWAVPSAIARGTIRSVDASQALALPGVLAVITPDNAPRLPGGGDPELALFQSRQVAYRGQFVAAVVAQTLETARDAASLVVVSYEPAPHDVTLTAGHPGLYKPDFVNPRQQTDTGCGDFDAAYAAAAVRVDATYTTPAEHNHPMEPHATIAAWHGDTLTLHDATQGPSRAAGQVAAVLGLGARAGPGDRRARGRRVRGQGHAAGQRDPRGHGREDHRAPGQVRRDPRADGRRDRPPGPVDPAGAAGRGRRTGGWRRWATTSSSQTSTLTEFTEQSAVATRHMYAAPHRRTTHRVVRLDVPTPSWMRAPGECPGMFALESAMDELADRCGIDPVELRLRNEPAVHPETGQPFSSRNLAACLREGAARFGWAGRDPAPGVRRDGPVAVRDRGGGLHLPGPGGRLAGAGERLGGRAVPGLDRRGRHRDRSAHRADGRRGRGARRRRRRTSSCASATARCRPR